MIDDKLYKRSTVGAVMHSLICLVSPPLKASSSRRPLDLHLAFFINVICVPESAAREILLSSKRKRLGFGGELTRAFQRRTTYKYQCLFHLFSNTCRQNSGCAILL
ncbi:hypothetical protein GOP47_0023764 [Adiantum capillus-veneris]|uniref:Uncharacterized protein n=1 Tax=Adiantum capillus-veneris TaxID=13818 RepID=A0A9D4U6A3_ADICA|nr:hypothetical protein GOP47_0023764 [Adiantum capillus-veneris]